MGDVELPLCWITVENFLVEPTNPQYVLLLHRSFVIPVSHDISCIETREWSFSVVCVSKLSFLLLLAHHE